MNSHALKFSDKFLTKFDEKLNEMLTNVIHVHKKISCIRSRKENGIYMAAGHFIVIYGYDKDGFLVNDPNCVARSRRSWSFSELKGQIKNIWVLGGELKDDFSMENNFSIVTEYSTYVTVQP